MTKSKKTLIRNQKFLKMNTTQDLRRKAEELLKNKPIAKIGQLSDDESRRLIHELEVHQIELEMMNEELVLVNQRAEELANKYVELYDFAPSGYYTISKDGLITGVNLTGAQMLGKARVNIINSYFRIYVSVSTFPSFNLFLDKVFGSKAKQTCDIRLSRTGSSPCYLQLTGIADENGQQCFVTAIDVTKMKLAEQVLLAANKEIVLQNEDIAKRESELIIANNEIAFQSELLLANSFLEKLISNANAPIVVWDAQFRITHFNSTSELLTGLNEGDVLMQSVWLLMPHAIVANPKTLIRKILTYKPWDGAEIGVRHLDGTVRTVLWNSATLFSTDGLVPVASIAQGQDISERKLAEEERARRSELITMLLQSIPDIIFYKDTEGVYIECNPPFADFVGKPKNEIIGKTDYDLFDKEVADFFRYQDREMLKKNKVLHYERWISYPDGTLALMDTIKTPYRTEEGRVVGVLGISRDITEKNAAEVKLKESETKYQLLFENMSEGFSLHEIITNEQGKPVDFRFLDANKAYESHVGVKPEDIIGKTILSIVSYVDRQQIERYGKVALTGEP